MANTGWVVRTDVNNHKEPTSSEPLPLPSIARPTARARRPLLGSAKAPRHLRIQVRPVHTRAHAHTHEHLPQACIFCTHLGACPTRPMSPQQYLWVAGRSPSNPQPHTPARPLPAVWEPSECRACCCPWEREGHGNLVLPGCLGKGGGPAFVSLYPPAGLGAAAPACSTSS